MMKAASSDEPCLTGRVSAGPAGAAGLAAEAAGDDAEMKLRFMPLHMM